MDLRKILGKNILIRLTDDRDGFVSTTRIGVLYRTAENWSVETAEHTSVELPSEERRKRE